MRIGEFARFGGTPLATIRFREREVLLPTPARAECNARVHTGAHDLLGAHLGHVVQRGRERRAPEGTILCGIAHASGHGAKPAPRRNSRGTH